jgi:hypothetical protein
MPAVLLALLAVFVPLGYSIWKSMPSTQLKLPQQQDLKLDMQPGIDWSKMKPVELPAPPTFKFTPPTIQVPQPQIPPPVHVPIIAPPQPRHR